MFENFSPQSRAISRGAACGPSAQMLETSVGCKQAAHHPAAWFSRDLMRFRAQNFAAAKNCRIFWSEIGSNSRAISRGAACRSSTRMLRTSEECKQAVHHRAVWISARSHAISNAKFRGREKFSKISVGNHLRIAQNLTCCIVPTLGTVLGDL